MMDENDTLRVECERHLQYTFGAYYERDVVKLMRFARAQQAKGLREAASILRNDQDNVCDWTDSTRDMANDMADYLEAQATTREQETK